MAVEETINWVLSAPTLQASGMQGDLHEVVIMNDMTNFTGKSNGKKEIHYPVIIIAESKN